MRNFKIAAIVMAAALLVIGASMTAYAGWVSMGNGDYTYENSDGDLVTNTWKKDGTKWFYLDDDGYMARNTLVDAGDCKKYVDDDGAMVVNDWRWFQGEDDEDGYWYYFGSNGKSTKGKKKIEGKTYFFDETFHMLTGWIDAATDSTYDAVDDDIDDPYLYGTYFCGEDGAMVSGTWMEVECDKEETGDSSTNWIYLKSNGQKQTSGDKVVATAKINGATYAFDKDGIMKSGWVELAEGTFYFGEKSDGSKKTGWFWAKSNRADEKDDDVKYHWYYATNSGIVRSQIKKINGKYYAFDKDGIMLSGYYFINVDGDNKIATMSYNDKAVIYPGEGETYKLGKIQGEIKTKEIFETVDYYGPVYFFGEEETDGAMKTGTVDVTTGGDDGKTYSATFGSTTTNRGQAFAGTHKKALYTYGVKVKASEEDKIAIYEKQGNGKLVKTSAKEIIGRYKAGGLDTDYYFGTYTPEFKVGSKDCAGVVWAKPDADYIVITTSGSIVTGTTTKTDGDDYKVELKEGKIAKIYYER